MHCPDRRLVHRSHRPTATPRTWLLSAGLALGLLLTGCGEPGSAAQKPANSGKAAGATEVGVVTVQPQSQQLETTLPGRTQAYQMAEVRPQVSGVVLKRLFAEGTVVKRGQPLYQIDPALYQNAVTTAEANVAKAEATRKTAEAEARRARELIQVNAISEQEHEAREAAASQARADVALARANLDTARINLRYSHIEAPISGRVSLSTVTPGALVTANQTTALTTIVQTDPMYVDVTQTTAELLQLKRDWESGRYKKLDGQHLAVRIQLEDGSEYAHEARLQFAGVITNPTMNTVTLRAVVPNPDGVLLPGMYVQAKLPTGVASDALLVPQQAVSRDPSGRASVLVVLPDNKVEKRTVVLTRAIGPVWLLEAGLKAGERVIVDGLQRVRPGDVVKPVAVELRSRASAPPVDRAAAAASLREAAAQR